MKTARFSEVVKQCGRPETYLVLTDPSKDKTLQARVKAQRVLTVTQATVGAKTDYGEVGFKEGGTRQYFIFPKSLRLFVGRKIVGSSTTSFHRRNYRPANVPPHPSPRVRKKRRRNPSTRKTRTRTK
jgi:hypothetical protein